MSFGLIGGILGGLAGGIIGGLASEARTLRWQTGSSVVAPAKVQMIFSNRSWM